MTTEAVFKYRGQPPLDYVATVARLAGEIFLLPDGRPVVSGGEYAIGGLGIVHTEGVFSVPAASATVFALGEAVFWNEATNLAVPKAGIGAGAFLIGTAVVAKTNGQTKVLVDLNANIAQRQQKSISAATTLDVADLESTIFCDTQAGAFTVTLPPAASCVGRRFTFIRTGTGVNIATIDGNAAETVDGSLTYVALDAIRDTVTIESDGSNWFLVAFRG